MTREERRQKSFLKWAIKMEKETREQLKFFRQHVKNLRRCIKEKRGW